MTSRTDEIAYEPLGWNTNFAESKRLSASAFLWPKDKSNRAVLWRMCAVIALSLSIGFIAGVLTASQVSTYRAASVLKSVAPRIPLASISREFVYTSPFSQEPPQGDISGNVSEPIWDALIPNGLGYFKDSSLAPQTSIPTVFHQLHCLYLLRRAYYSGSEDLQDFDFGKDRAAHVAHCFDYIQQGLTCSADTTVEPGVDQEHGFLGSGFKRECRDFDSLISFVESHRVFNASGFLANGLEHGKFHGRA